MDVEDLLNTFQDLVDELYRNPKRLTVSLLEPLLKGSSQKPLYAKDRGIGKDQILVDDIRFLTGLRTFAMIDIAWPRLLKHRSDFRFFVSGCTHHGRRNRRDHHYRSCERQKHPFECPSLRRNLQSFHIVELNFNLDVTLKLRAVCLP
jgi:hypothetical protein